MTDKKYDVGQVVFLLSKNEGLQPARVVEEVARRTINGSKVSYILQLGDTGQLVDMSTIGREVFSSIDEAYTTLVMRMTKSIRKLVDAAAERAVSCYGAEVPTKASSLEEEEEDVQAEDDGDTDQVDDDKQLVELPDGTTARVWIPKKFA